VALPININDLLNGRTVEWERIEFKEEWNPERTLHSICAFANDINNWGGGYIIVGVKENNGYPILPPAGLDPYKIDKIQKEVLNLCNRLKPHHFPVIEPVFFQEKHILIIWVPGGQNRPYQSPVSLGKRTDYAYYIRRFSNTVKAQFEDEKELLSLAGTIPFDDRINHKAELLNLNLVLIQTFLKEVESDLYKTAAQMPFEQLCRQMMIVDGTNEYIKPRNAGLLFFNDLPQKFIPLSQIEVVEFEKTPGDDRLSEKIFQGPIHQQIRDVMTYIKNTVIKEYIHKLPDRAEAVRFFNYPYVALEESIVNAMYHRSYEIREPVEIRIHPNRIEFLSYPGPDRSIKQSDIEKGTMIARRYRNRRIGEFLKELKLTEGRCTGIPKIINSLKNNGSPPPIFETDEERSYFITILNIHPLAYIEEIEDKQIINDINEYLDKKSLSILEICIKPGKRSEILEFLGVTNQTKNFKTNILPLIEAGYLRQTIMDKPNSKKQRYETSEKGLRAVELSKKQLKSN
jgi:ATP-dependent DNA helicase RecG